MQKPPKRRLKPTSGSHWPRLESTKIINRASFDIGDCTIELTNIDRMIWKNIPKARLIEYYNAIAPLILPYLFDRPQSLHIKPTNANTEGFFIKDMEGRQPACAAIFTDTRRHPLPGKRPEIDYLVCNNEGTLLWMINLGCIDINPWSSRTWSADTPDYIVVDLDPTVKDNSGKHLEKLRDTAMAAKAYCDRIRVKAFAKTSGKTGIHFYIPCENFDFTQARTIAEHLCSEIHALAPRSSTIENSTTSRDDKVYVDPSQNDYADTVAAPYSIRPYHIPTISTPLEWREINPRLDPTTFTIDNILLRLSKKGDLFTGVLDPAIAAANTKKLARLFI